MKNTLLILLIIILTGCDLYHGKMYSKKELISLKVGDSVYVRVLHEYVDAVVLRNDTIMQVIKLRRASPLYHNLTTDQNYTYVGMP